MSIFFFYLNEAKDTQRILANKTIPNSVAKTG